MGIEEIIQMEKLKQWMPILSWLPNYQRANLKGDLNAGLTTAVLLIPQSMAYAMLAGLPPIVGLYASIVPLAIYAMFGSSRELAVGPVAMVSLLVASGVGAIAETGSEQFITYAVLLALMVGVIQLGMGIFKAGFLVNFLSHPVISGFASAAALIIGLSQLKHLLGVSIPRGKVHETLITAAQELGNANGSTLIIGILSVALLMGLKKYRPLFPRALLVVVLGSLAVYGLGLDAAGVGIVGNIPAGFPTPGIPSLDLEAMGSLLPIAITISMIGFMESISVAKSFASRQKYEVQPNQELIGLGLANIAAALFRGYPVTGGFSRTAVNASAGSKSGLSSIITATVIAIALLFLTPLFYYLPNAVLAAIIMTAVFGLIDTKEPLHLWKVKKADTILLMITFIATLALGIEEGILIGVGGSLLWFVIRSTYPHTAVLGQIPGTQSFRNVKNYPEAETIPGVAIVRMDAQFYFGNVNFLKARLKKIEAEMNPKMEALIFDASGMNQLDASADEMLHKLHEDYAERDIQLYFANVKYPVREVMENSGLIKIAGEEHFYLSVYDAVVGLKELRANQER